MATIVDFRTRVKFALGIPGATTERGFDDGSLDRAIQFAAEEFSLYVPVRATADVAVAGGARTISVALLVRPIAVAAAEYPLGAWPRQLLDFDRWGGVVTLDHTPPATGYTVRLYFTQQHLIDGAGATVSQEHEHVIVEGATAMAILARAMGAANTAETSTATPVTYQHLRNAQQRLEHWQALLRRLSNTLGRSHLYSPALRPENRELVAW